MDVTPPDDLLEWLEKNPEMLNWDMMVALPVATANYALQQDLLRQEGEGDGGARLSETLSSEALGYTLHFDGYRLFLPGLSLQSPSFNDGWLRLSLWLEGGTLLRSVSNYGVVLAEGHSTRNGLQAQVDVQLEHSGMALRLDLGKGRNHALALGTGEIEQQLGAEFLAKALGKLPDDERYITLAAFTDGNSFHELSKVHARSQAVAGVDGRQALLWLLSMKHGGQAFDPVDGTGFPFMLAADHDTATAVCASHWLHRMAYGQAMYATFAGEVFVPMEEDGLLTGLKLEQGRLGVASGSYRFDTFELNYEAFELVASAQSPLTVSLSRDSVVQGWKPAGEIKCKYRYLGGAWAEATLPCADLDFSFSLANAEGTDSLQGRLTPVAPGPETVSTAAEQTLVRAVDYVVKRAFINVLAKNLTARVVQQAMPCLRLAGGHAFKPAAWAMPNNVAMTGDFQGEQGPLRIVEQRALVAPGEAMQFTVEPPRAALHWRLEPLSGPSEALGHVTAQGLYTAPLQAQLEGRSQRVRLVAESDDQSRAEAMITLHRRAISVNPQYKLCLPELLPSGTLSRPAPFQLTAITLPGPASEVLWEIVNVREGSGSVDRSGTTVTYTPGTQQPGDAFFVEEIKATYGVESFSVLALVEYDRPRLYLFADEALDGNGRLRLKAQEGVNPRPTARFELPKLGAGAIEVDDEGTWYRPDPANEDCIVLITASYTKASGEVVEGYLAVPLPLDSAMQVRKEHVSMAGMLAGNAAAQVNAIE